IEEELREGLDAPKWVAGGCERTVVVAVEKNHWDVLDAADIGAKADDRLAEIEVLDHREVGGKLRADLGALARRRRARRPSGAKLQQNSDDSRSAKMLGAHSPSFRQAFAERSELEVFRATNGETDSADP